MKIEQRLEELGLVLPEALKSQPGVRLPFSWARVRGNRVYLSGHGPQAQDGTIAPPLGKVGAEVSEDQAYQSARLTALAMLGTLKRELGDLDRITAWLRVFGMVNVAAGFNRTPAVINGFSDLIVEVFGPEIGNHTRSAIGVAELPFNMPVELEAEVEIDAGLPVRL